MGFIDKFKTFFNKKKEEKKQIINFEDIIAMMRSEEMFAKKVGEEKTDNGEVALWENTERYNLLLQLILKSGIENVIKLMNADLKTLNRDSIETRVLGERNAEWSYKWVTAGFGKNNMKTHEEIILAAQDPSISYHFVNSVEGVNKEKHSKIILEKGFPSLSKSFAQSVKVDSIDHLKKYANYLVDYVQPNGMWDSGENIMVWVQDIFRDKLTAGNYKNLLAEDTEENKELKEYIVNYTNAMLKRREFNKIKDINNIKIM